MIVCLSVIEFGYSQSENPIGTIFSTESKTLDLHSESNTKQMVMADVLNVRSSPDSRSEVIGKIKEGSIVSISNGQSGREFLKITYADGTDVKEGFVSKDYLTPLFVVEENYRSYMKVEVLDKGDHMVEILKLFEITPLGRKEILHKEGYASGHISISLTPIPEVDSIKRVITINRTENDCCECGVITSHIVQGVVFDHILPDYNFEMDENGNEVMYQMKIPDAWEKDQFHLAIVKGTFEDFEANKLDSLQIVDSFIWRGKGLVNLKG